MLKVTAVVLATMAMQPCNAVRSRAAEGVHCSQEPPPLQLAFVLPDAGQTCSSHADSYARDLDGSVGLTCGVIRTEADCRSAAAVMRVSGAPEPVFTTTELATKALPGWCSVHSLLQSPMRVTWNNDTDEVPARKVASASSVEVKDLPVCGCYPRRLCDVPVKGTTLGASPSIASVGAKVKSASIPLIAVKMLNRRPLGTSDFSYNNFDFYRVSVSGPPTNAAILDACQKIDLRPACDHSTFADGRCEVAGGNGSLWHFSLPEHNNEHGVPVDKVTGSYFYTGTRQFPLQNTGSAHRWASAADKAGFTTFCVDPSVSRNFQYELWEAVRIKVNGNMTTSVIDAACSAAGMRPVCDHSSYLDGRCVLVGGAWHFSHPNHDAEYRVRLANVQGAYFYSSNANQGLSLLNTGETHRWSTGGDQMGDTFCTRPMRDEQSFMYKDYAMRRMEVKGEMSADNILKACQAVGLRPVCDHANYLDGRCVIVGGAWHLSHPAHDAENNVPLARVKGAFFYAGVANSGRSLANLANTHRWSTGNERDGDTFCTRPRRGELSFVWKGYTFRRTEVNGTMNSDNILAACKAVGMQPVCDHAHYLDGRCVLAGGAWHFSHPNHAEDNAVPLDKIQGAYFYAGAANEGRSLANIVRSHAWSNSNSESGDTFCTVPRRVDQSFSYNGHTLQRVAVEGEMTSDNILKACSKAGLRPVCDHAHYLDGRCIVVGSAWHFSHPEHGAANQVPLERVKGAYFYAGQANAGRSLSNIANTHRWSTSSSQDGDTFCTAPRRAALSFSWSGHTFQRTEVRGEMNSANILAACTALGSNFKPVCDHSAYQDGKCVAFGAWHLSHPSDAHSCKYVENCRNLVGAYFYAGAANSGRSLENIGNTHRWSTAVDVDGDTYCVQKLA